MLNLKNKLAMRKLALAIVSMAAVFALVFGFVMGTRQTVVAGSLAKTTTLRVDTSGTAVDKKRSNDIYETTLPMRFGPEQGVYTTIRDDARGIEEVNVNTALKSGDPYIDEINASRSFVITYNVATETTNLFDGSQAYVGSSFGPDGTVTINFQSLTGTNIDYTKVTATNSTADFWLDKTTFNQIVDHYYSNNSTWTYIQSGGITNDPSFVQPTAFELAAVKKIAAITGKKENGTALTAAEYRAIALGWPELSRNFLINTAPVDASLLTNTSATSIILKNTSDTANLSSAINYAFQARVLGATPTFQIAYPSQGQSYTTATGLDSTSFIILVTVIGLAIIAALLIWWYRVVGLVASVCITMFLAILLAIFGAANINVDVTTLLAMSASFLMLLKLVVDQAEAISGQITAGLSTKEAFRHSIKRRFITAFDFGLVMIIAAISFALLGNNALKDFGIGVMIGAGTMILCALAYSTWLWIAMDPWVIMSKYAATGAWRTEFNCPSQKAAKNSSALAFDSIGSTLIMFTLGAVIISGVILASIAPTVYAGSLNPTTSFYLIASSPLDVSRLPGGYVVYHEVLTLKPSLEIWRTLTNNQVHVYIVNSDQGITTAFADKFLEDNAVTRTTVSDRGTGLLQTIYDQFNISTFSSWFNASDANAVTQVDNSLLVGGTAVGSVAGYMLFRYGIFFGLPTALTLVFQSAIVFGLLVTTRIGLNGNVGMGFLMLMLVNFASLSSSVNIGVEHVKKTRGLDLQGAKQAVREINSAKIREDYKNYLAFLLVALGAMLLGDGNDALFGILMVGAFFSFTANYYFLSMLMVRALVVRDQWVQRKPVRQLDETDEQSVVGINV